MSKKKEQQSGAKRMRQLGKKAVQLWFTEEEWLTLAKAAIQDQRPITQFVAKAALEAAVAMRKKARRPKE